METITIDLDRYDTLIGLLEMWNKGYVAPHYIESLIEEAKEFKELKIKPTNPRTE